MDDTAKYLIHADIAADGVVERSDVVGAVFGQTEGLLGDELDIRDLQQSAKLGRIDVEVDSEGGRSFGSITVGSNLDRVETAILAAALETIDRVGPCRSRIDVRRIEDVRAAKRREIVDRAEELLAEGFDEGAVAGDELVESVRESLRVADVTEYEGLPAGPSVADGDAVVVVEGRADVLALLRYGVKNAVAVEGTDVPDAVAALTHERTATAFLDGDRGGSLILRELAQVGDVDYVARAPDDRSVEDLSREEVFSALREKVPVEVVLDGESEAVETATDGSSHPSPAAESAGRNVPPTDAAAPGRGEDGDTSDAASGATTDAEARGPDEPPSGAPDESSDGPPDESPSGAPDRPQTLAEHATAVVDGDGRVRLLDAEGSVLDEGDADAVAELVSELADGADGADGEAPPNALVVDAAVTQATLDVAAQHGIAHVVGRERGPFTKQPAAVRVRTASELAP